MSLCQICENRRSRRHCPGVLGDICPRCCGEEREVTVDCPFDCEFLREARRHEKPSPITAEDIPHKDIEITDRFLREHEPLLIFMSQILLQAVVETQGAVDTDVRESLESMIRTHLTLDSGLIYETRSPNPYAAAIQQHVQANVEEFRRRAAERSGVNTIRDKDVLGVLAFLQRMELHQNNGRRRSRAFLDFLHTNFRPPEQPAEDSGLIAP